MKPLFPAMDAASHIREAGFALLYRDGRPVEVADLAASVGIDLHAAGTVVDSLAEAGWLDRDAAGRVTGAAGLSLTTGSHRLVIGDTAFRTWCAYDGLGIASALGVDAVVETACGECESPIRHGFQAGVPDRSGPERLWLAEGGADLRGSFCTPTVLLCGDDHGQAWAEKQDGRGRLLDLVDGARQGAADWAGSADAARRLS